MSATTANRYLLDTNILTDLIKNPSGRVKERIATIGEANICTSIIVACELRFGARKKNAPLLTARIERLLQTIEVLPLDGDVDRAYAEVRAMLESAGRPSGANDLLIAAHAVNEDCTLVTNNVSEFVHVAGLVVENWLAS
jgi:tRNA(fMet)-specific endonuclease VapC